MGKMKHIYYSQSKILHDVLMQTQAIQRINLQLSMSSYEFRDKII